MKIENSTEIEIAKKKKKLNLVHFIKENSDESQRGKKAE